jgi:hypothetical protein
MGYSDLILFPIYTYLFYLLFSYRRKKIKDPILRKYHLIAFWVKVFATVAMSVFNVWISPGDSTTLYFPEGLNIFHLILHNPDNIKWIFVTGKNFDFNLLLNEFTQGYFASESNYFVIRLVAILSFVSFGTYSVINLFFSMIALTGIWKLFVFFYELYPKLHKQLAIAILFFPTVVFWSCGILKDPICIGALGWLAYSIYQALFKKTNITGNLLIAFISAWVLSVVKPYILYSFLPFFTFYLVQANLYLIKNTVLKTFTFLVIVCVGVLGVIALSDTLQKEMGNFAVEKLASSVKGQQSNFIAMADQAESSFSLGVEYDGSIGSLVKVAPAAINATLFRPYLWESKKLSTLLSSLESLSLMLFTLYVLIKAGPILFFKTIFSNPMVTFCFFYSILFALFIGTTTLNFGTLVRYKIPCMPFYTIALILINQQRLASQHKKSSRDKTAADNIITEKN